MVKIEQEYCLFTKIISLTNAEWFYNFYIRILESRLHLTKVSLPLRSWSKTTATQTFTVRYFRRLAAEMEKLADMSCVENSPINSVPAENQNQIQNQILCWRWNRLVYFTSQICYKPTLWLRDYCLVKLTFPWCACKARETL